MELLSAAAVGEAGDRKKLETPETMLPILDVCGPEFGSADDDGSFVGSLEGPEVP